MSAAIETVRPQGSGTASKVSKGRTRQCAFCSKTFTRTEHLERHVRAHTRDRPFRCDVCGGSYGRQDTLARHQRRNCENRWARSESDAADVRQAGFDTVLLFPAEDDAHPSPAFRSGALPVRHVGLSATPVHSQPNVGEGGFENIIIPPGISPSFYNFTTPQDDQTQLLSLQSTTETQPTSFHFDRQPEAPSTHADSNYGLELGDDLAVWMTEDIDWGALHVPFAAPSVQQEYGAEGVKEHNQRAPGSPAQRICKMWFARTHEHGDCQPASGTQTPVQNRILAEVDDGYLQSLHQRFPTSALDQTLPSATFLNFCVRSYFARFHHVFPVIHKPSFRPCRANSTLLLSICSIGSLFTGSANARSHGVKIFERLNKVILATWDDIITLSTEEIVSMVQAALLGQTFGLLSGEPRHLSIVDAFHGTVISWARRSKMFQARHSSQEYKNLDSGNCKDAWRRWSKKEEIIRLVAALHIHDVEIASILHHEPFLRHAAVDLAKPAPDRTFNARNSQEWYAHLNCCILASPDCRVPLINNGAPEAIRCPFTQATSFSAYADLERLLAAISEERHSDRLDQAVQSSLTKELIEFHQRNLVTLSADADSFGLHILWHLCFMSLVTDFDLFERAIGREGKQMDAADRKSVGSWAASQSARRAKVHMQQIQKRLEALPIGLEPTIHVPRAAFLVAISWYCAFCYMPSNQDRQPSPVEYPELRLLGLDSDVWGHGTGSSSLEINDVLCRLADLLGRLGHWEIARKFAAIIGELVVQ